MSTLEREVVDKYNQLDSAARERVRKVILNSKDVEEFTRWAPEEYLEWDRKVEEIIEDIRQDNGGLFPDIGAMKMLQDFREGIDDDE